jgi:hypothetical protein
MSWPKAIMLNLPLLIAGLLALLPIEQRIIWTINPPLFILGLLLVMGWQYRELLKRPGFGLLKVNGAIPVLFYGAGLVVGLYGLLSLAEDQTREGPGGPVTGWLPTLVQILFLHSWVTYLINAKRTGTSMKPGVVAILMLFLAFVYVIYTDFVRIMDR